MNGLTQAQMPLLHCLLQKFPVSGSQQMCGADICIVRQSTSLIESGPMKKKDRKLQLNHISATLMLCIIIITW